MLQQTIIFFSSNNIRVSNFLTMFQNRRCIFNWNFRSICILWSHSFFLYADFAYMHHYNVKKKERTKERGSIHKETNLSSVITLLYMNIFRVIQHFLHSSAYIFAHCRFTEGYTLPYEYLKKKKLHQPPGFIFRLFQTSNGARRNSKFSLRFFRRLIT